MNSGDAAEELIKISLEGTEMVLRLTGDSAKEIAAALIAVASNHAKTSSKGKRWLAQELSAGTDVKVFTLPQKDAAKFTREAKRYGISYCAIRNREDKSDHDIDIIVREADAGRINRLVERFGLSAVRPSTSVTNATRETERPHRVPRLIFPPSVTNATRETELPYTEADKSEPDTECGDVETLMDELNLQNTERFLDEKKAARDNAAEAVDEPAGSANPTEARAEGAPSEPTLNSVAPTPEKENEALNNREQAPSAPVKDQQQKEADAKAAPRRSVRARLAEIKERQENARTANSREKNRGRTGASRSKKNKNKGR